jgi:hypothetical protein
MQHDNVINAAAMSAQSFCTPDDKIRRPARRHP